MPLQYMFHKKNMYQIRKLLVYLLDFAQVLKNQYKPN